MFRLTGQYIHLVIIKWYKKLLIFNLSTVLGFIAIETSFISLIYSIYYKKQKQHNKFRRQNWRKMWLLRNKVSFLEDWRKYLILDGKSYEDFSYTTAKYLDAWIFISSWRCVPYGFQRTEGHTEKQDLRLPYLINLYL